MSDKPRNIVRGQKVKPVLVTRAKELRSTMTPAEKILWHALRKNRIERFHFRRQQIIDGSIADFYCHAAALVLELDGKIHEYQRERDQARDAIIRERGIQVLRIRTTKSKTV